MSAPSSDGAGPTHRSAPTIRFQPDTYAKLGANVAAPARVVAITGGSAGIGRATALRLARDRSALAICGRRRDRLEAVAAEIAAAGGEALPVVADVTSEADMLAFVAQAVERFGRIDVMMCNAGFGIAGAIDDISPEQMHKLIDVNYMGTYYAARAALAVFRRQGHGHLVIISSIVGKRGVPYMSACAPRSPARPSMSPWYIQSPPTVNSST